MLQQIEQFAAITGAPDPDPRVQPDKRLDQSLPVIRIVIRKDDVRLLIFH